MRMSPGKETPSLYFPAMRMSPGKETPAITTDVPNLMRTHSRPLLKRHAAAESIGSPKKVKLKPAAAEGAPDIIVHRKPAAEAAPAKKAAQAAEAEAAPAQDVS